MAIKFSDTLGNDEWLRENEEKIKSFMPETWTHMDNLNGLQIGLRLKLLGIEWRSVEEFSRVMLFFEKIGMIERDNRYLLRANPVSVFRKERAF